MHCNSSPFSKYSSRESRGIDVSSFLFKASAYTKLCFDFAIPFNLVQKIAGELTAHGAVTRGYLGIDVEELSQQQQAEHEQTHVSLRIV